MPRCKPKPPRLARAHPLARRLAAAYVLAEGSGSTIGDASGYANFGALVGGPAWLAARCGTALDFDGLDDRIDLLRPILLPDNTAWTIAVGIQPDVLETDGLYGYDYTTAKYTCFYYTSAPSIRLRNNANVEVAWYPTGFAAGQWNDLLLACDGGDSSNLELWVNGISQGTRTLADSSQTITRLATYGGATGNRGLDGRLDYFFAWCGRRLRPKDLTDRWAMFRPRRTRLCSVRLPIGGPYRVAARSAWHAAAAVGQAFCPGAANAQAQGFA